MNKEIFNDVEKDLEDKPNYFKNMIKFFPSPFSDDDRLVNTIDYAVKNLNALRSTKKDVSALLGGSTKNQFDFNKIKSTKMPQSIGHRKQVIDETVKLFEGMGNWGSPLAVANVCSNANYASIVASIAAIMYSPNILEGEYAFNTVRGELESGAMLADLFGWDNTKAGTIYTYGGSGCWTYNIKYALTRVFKNSRVDGVRVDGKVICSEQAHYTWMNSTDWTGLGMKNVIRIPNVDKTNTIDLVKLEEVLKDLKSKNIPVISIICTEGSTDANSFDPIKEVRELLDKYPNGPEYGKATLYADAVIGWAWAAFKNYDFKNNPLQFSEAVLKEAKANALATEAFIYADAVGVDFHKSGFSPYTSSCFVYKDAKEFEELLRRPGSAYLQVRFPYNPLDYTLEVSRSAQGSLAGWATLKFLGVEGFQSLLGGILEAQSALRTEIEKRNIVCVNKFDHGLVSLFRIYDHSVSNANEEYEKELNDPKYKPNLIKNNKFIKDIGDLMWDWNRSGKRINGKLTPLMSFSSGFRTTNYNIIIGKKDPEAYIYALKVFPMNPYTNKDTMNHILDCVEAAAKEISSRK